MAAPHHKNDMNNAVYFFAHDMPNSNGPLVRRGRWMPVPHLDCTPMASSNWNDAGSEHRTGDLIQKSFRIE